MRRFSLPGIEIQVLRYLKVCFILLLLYKKSTLVTAFANWNKSREDFCFYEMVSVSCFMPIQLNESFHRTALTLGSGGICALSESAMLFFKAKISLLQENTGDILYSKDGIGMTNNNIDFKKWSKNNTTHINLSRIKAVQINVRRLIKLLSQGNFSPSPLLIYISLICNTSHS